MIIIKALEHYGFFSFRRRNNFRHTRIRPFTEDEISLSTEDEIA